MDILFFMFLAAGATAVSLAMLAIWAPRPTRVRVIACLAAVLFLPTVYFQFTELLSKPKPVVALNGTNASVERPKCFR